MAYGCPGSQILSQHYPFSKIEHHPPRIRENYTHIYGGGGGGRLCQTNANTSTLSQTEKPFWLNQYEIPLVKQMLIASMIYQVLFLL